LQPVSRGEFDDSALLKTYGQSGLGVFPGPTAIEAEICREYDVAPVGRIAAIRESYYAISVERRVKHPAIAAICAGAKQNLPVAPPAGRGRTRSR